LIRIRKILQETIETNVDYTFNINEITAITGGYRLTSCDTMHLRKGKTVTIDGNASETLDGALTYLLAGQYDSVEIVCDGSNWHLI